MDPIRDAEPSLATERADIDDLVFDGESTVFDEELAWEWDRLEAEDA